MPVAELALNKSARYRQRMRAQGLRPVQFWAPDTRSPEYRERLRQQCLALKDDSEEDEVLRLTVEAARLIDGWEWDE